MNCKICNQETSSIFNSKILGKYDIEYYHCSNCGFLQTENPFWLEEAYDESINDSDTGYMRRNINLSQKLTILLFLYFNKNGSYLDYAGGHGVFVRIMRDIGFDFFWDDLYSKNTFSRGFEYKEENIEAITTFESFEHFDNPIAEIEIMLKISKNIIFSTMLLPNPIPKPSDWWYYGLDHGQHISFYSKETLVFIAKKYNLHYANAGGLHLFTEDKISPWKLQISRLNRIGFHNLIKKALKSKTWSDYLKMSQK